MFAIIKIIDSYTRTSFRAEMIYLMVERSSYRGISLKVINSQLHSTRDTNDSRGS